MSGETGRASWVFVFLAILVLATAAQLLGLLTPSWQFVYLEDGRTEHHHGLWLDCKRDYSNEYGRPREYYERLHRLDSLQTPFDQFFLPPLQCVYKFDYWLDDEDWYEHGYDENQLQGDAYQHLFLGWKIAALAAHLFAAVCSLAALVFTVCGFCHRLCVVVASVLVTFSVIASFIGNGLFWGFANLQDNNIIKSEDGLLYEQHFGWSFWSSLLGNALIVLANMMSCAAVRAAFLNSSSCRHIKIRPDLDSDGAQLLQRMSYATGTAPSSVTSAHQIAVMQEELPPLMLMKQTPSSNFRRSKSSVYRIDSEELRQWERDAWRRCTQPRPRPRSLKQQPHYKQSPSSNAAIWEEPSRGDNLSPFKRTASLPNIERRGLDQKTQRPLLLAPAAPSMRNLSATREFIPRRDGGEDQTKSPRLHSFAELSQESPERRPPNLPQIPLADVTYEYVDQKSLAEGIHASALPLRTSTKLKLLPLHSYDRVPISAMGDNMQATSFGVFSPMVQTDEYYLPPRQHQNKNAPGSNSSTVSTACSSLQRETGFGTKLPAVTQLPPKPRPPALDMSELMRAINVRNAQPESQFNASHVETSNQKTQEHFHPPQQKKTARESYGEDRVTVKINTFQPQQSDTPSDCPPDNRLQQLRPFDSSPRYPPVVSGSQPRRMEYDRSVGNSACTLPCIRAANDSWTNV